MTEEKRLLNYVEAAEHLGISRYSLRNLVCRREIPFIKVGTRIYFTRAKLDQWIEDRTTKPIRV